MLLIEQNDEWLVSRRYLSEESLALVLDDTAAQAAEEVIPELQAALNGPPPRARARTRERAKN